MVYEMYSLVIVASLLDTLPGIFVGLLFVKIVNRLPILSTYIKAVILGVCMWLPLFVFVFLTLAQPSVLVFVLLVGFIFAVDSILFAYLFTQWSKPSVVKSVQAGVPSFLTLHRIGMLGSGAIVCVMCVMVWRMIELLPRLESDLSSQLIFLVSIVVMLFFSYALALMIGLLRHPKQS